MASTAAGPSRFSHSSSSRSPPRARGRDRIVGYRHTRRRCADPESPKGDQRPPDAAGLGSPKASILPSSPEELQRGRSRVRRPSGNQNQHMRRSGYHTLNIVSLGKVFHVEKRFKLVRELGHGAYGTVISVQDEISGDFVAIKQVERVFEKPSLAKRALREITLLRHFSNHENITGLLDIDAVTPEFNEVYLFMEPMEADLHQIIRSGQSLTNAHLQYFVYQILRGLKYIHSAGVIHRDLKPGNLLVNSNCELKICDFGLSRGYDDTAPEEEATQLTEYVATRWYRAPEIMLSFKRYGKAIDLWSLGCILAELLTGKPLFKGKDYVDQLNKILDVLGMPDEQMIQNIKSDRARKYVRSLPYRPAKSLAEMIPGGEPPAIDLLVSLLQFDPDSRPDAVGALRHPWLDVLRTNGEGSEPDCPRKFERWRDIEALETLEEYKRAIWSEIQHYRDEVRGILPSRAPSSSATEETSNSVVSSMIGSQELAQAMEDLELGSDAQDDTTCSRFGGETNTESHLARRLAPLPESGQAEAFDDQQVDQQHQERDSRTRKDSVIGGKLLRSLSTISVHEATGGDSHQLYSKAAVGQYILQKSAADAPPSERPKEFT